jgi:hypothetical protein
MDVLNLLFMLLDEFFVLWPLLLLLYQIYMLFRLLSKNFTKKSKKNINLGGVHPEPAGR